MIKHNYRAHYNCPAMFFGGDQVGWHKKDSVTSHRCFHCCTDKAVIFLMNQMYFVFMATLSMMQQGEFHHDAYLRCEFSCRLLFQGPIFKTCAVHKGFVQ